VAKFYNTTITVLEGEPTPALFIAMMRYLPVRLPAPLACLCRQAGCLGASSSLACPGMANGVGVWLPDQPFGQCHYLRLSLWKSWHLSPFLLPGKIFTIQLILLP